MCDPSTICERVESALNTQKPPGASDPEVLNGQVFVTWNWPLRASASATEDVRSSTIVLARAMMRFWMIVFTSKLLSIEVGMAALRRRGRVGRAPLLSDRSDRSDYVLGNAVWDRRPGVLPVGLLGPHLGPPISPRRRARPLPDPNPR